MLIISFAGVELVVAGVSHSLALFAEAGHMVSDAIALGLALLATWMAQLPASAQATFGYRRIEILAALLNGMGLLGIAAWIAWEAWSHWHMSTASEILSLPMLITAIVGLGVNSLNAVLLHPGSATDLNLRGAFLHMLADAISSVGVILAALLISLWDWQWVDSVVGLGVALLIGAGALPLIRQSVHILLEKVPLHLDAAAITAHLNQFEGVVAVQNLRIWTIALGQDALSAQLTVSFTDGTKRDRLLQQLQISLQQEFGLSEVFLQLSSGMPLAWLHPSIAEQIEPPH